MPTESTSGNFRYRTSFGHCPSRTAGTLTLKLVKTFEHTNSLRELKKDIVNENLVEKHFISEYSVKYDPIQKLLSLNFDCPIPLMRVQIYKENSTDSYEALLVDSGKLVDPTYEELLRGEQKIINPLPFLALPVGEMDEKIQKQITTLFKGIRKELKNKISEVIIGANRELTIILSSDRTPTSVFMGSDVWEEKILKLQKIVAFMEEKGKTPAIINLTNAKKVVVKFSDKF
ncbi:MAG: hypothetical protein A2504_05045 [Bdellovibrionales bacterium RIFOXYD12_FULL_39_22]|nr:MAG: hypothetical protein A2385_06780 [Bdellovibrionales bacterium RIFOXYB1_FULL_39_21]OFZ41975.1 MAG: hypothetical protein A2485_08750 [Bdellovibrionales bacterium RIFOXYC12_FULL_39_17]OFZ50691.1 MAG: hypothetical protein A2404_05700 [Bdellovibrionales bacterium RIFOXYC1_FULL_39_130]OFZ77914.1 MAG: hypothetical protein A2560_00870 [Bdellovibrionales bacterium RIFOXYD1_FULL_39_84]OFZ93650.1 MAG: hypothetical protein A2504_05045 [Bdellovibrionales bacterium RIFOXYD12_FULL_39_22]HLE10217.1 ce